MDIINGILIGIVIGIFMNNGRIVKLKKKTKELESENVDLKESRDMWVKLYRQDAVQILERN